MDQSQIVGRACQLNEYTNNLKLIEKVRHAILRTRSNPYQVRGGLFWIPAADPPWRLEIARTWDAYSDDHLGIKEFLVMGFCIGDPMIHVLLRLAPERVVAAALMQPSGFSPEHLDLFYQNNIVAWGLRSARNAFKSRCTWSTTFSPACTPPR